MDARERDGETQRKTRTEICNGRSIGWQKPSNATSYSDRPRHRGFLCQKKQKKTRYSARPYLNLAVQLALDIFTSPLDPLRDSLHLIGRVAPALPHLTGVRVESKEWQQGNAPSDRKQDDSKGLSWSHWHQARGGETSTDDTYKQRNCLRQTKGGDPC